VLPLSVSEGFDSSVANQVAVIRADLLSIAARVTDATGETLVEFTTRVRQVWVNELEPCHVDPVWLLFLSVLQ